ncbi:MAG: LytR C-terminal domain-containing protein [candidate division Zixibacteria bacterium]|nr:LytR C-terminal domain-containing protein [candidate division Zixibacteria bacterium]
MLLNKSAIKNTKIKRRSSRPRKSSRTLEMAILGVFIVIVVYGVSFILKINNGISRTIDTPVYNIRLQILNGCGKHGVADRIVKVLPSLVKAPLELNIVEIYDFKSYDVKKSFIISREADITIAKTLAGQLGLEPDNIVYEPIENNYRSVTATLVLGVDYNEKLLKPKK